MLVAFFGKGVGIETISSADKENEYRRLTVAAAYGLAYEFSVAVHIGYVGVKHDFRVKLSKLRLSSVSLHSGNNKFVSARREHDLSGVERICRDACRYCRSGNSRAFGIESHLVIIHVGVGVPRPHEIVSVDFIVSYFGQRHELRVNADIGAYPFVDERIAQKLCRHRPERENVPCF